MEWASENQVLADTRNSYNLFYMLPICLKWLSLDERKLFGLARTLFQNPTHPYSLVSTSFLIKLIAFVRCYWSSMLLSSRLWPRQENIVDLVASDSVEAVCWKLPSGFSEIKQMDFFVNPQDEGSGLCWTLLWPWGLINTLFFPFSYLVRLSGDWLGGKRGPAARLFFCANILGKQITFRTPPKKLLLPIGHPSNWIIIDRAAGKPN